MFRTYFINNRGDFEGTALDEAGKTIAVRHEAIEVLRRQPNGDWMLIIGDPNGRE